MSAKHLNKKNTRQKKLLESITVTKRADSSSDLKSVKSTEAAIIRQFNQIQKDYSKLMSDVFKEFDLLKGWFESQAVSKGNAIKSRLNSRLSLD